MSFQEPFFLKSDNGYYLYLKDEIKLSATVVIPDKQGHFITEENHLRHTDEIIYILKGYYNAELYPTMNSWTIELFEFGDRVYLRVPQMNIDTTTTYCYIKVSSFGKIEVSLNPYAFTKHSCLDSCLDSCLNSKTGK
jgi:hypothetical protein